MFMYKIIANWKMYLTIEQSRNLAAKVVKWWQEKECGNIELVLCPSQLALHDVARQTLDSPVGLGVQDTSLSPDLGAFTGQTAAQHLIESGADYAIIGHSEMREFYGVTDQMIAQQLRSLIKHKLIPVVCVGETKEERESGRADQVIASQLQVIFQNITLPDYDFYIAYEPRWAIGTGKPVVPKESERVHNLIRHTMIEFDKAANDRLHVLYGGSVDASNILNFLGQNSVEGALIGGASADLEKFREIVKVLQKNLC